MTTQTTINVDNETLAALHILSKQLDREELAPGTYEIEKTVHISASYKVGEPVDTRSAPDYRKTLAYVWERLLSEDQKNKLRRAVRDGAYANAKSQTYGELSSVLSSTQKPYTRAGSISGVATITEPDQPKQPEPIARAGEKICFEDIDGGIEGYLLKDIDSWDQEIPFLAIDPNVRMKASGWNFHFEKGLNGEWIAII